MRVEEIEVGGGGKREGRWRIFRGEIVSYSAVGLVKNEGWRREVSPVRIIAVVVFGPVRKKRTRRVRRGRGKRSIGQLTQADDEIALDFFLGAFGVC